MRFTHNRVKLVVIIVSIAAVGAASFVYGFIVGQTVPVNITLVSGSPFGIYFDQARTQPVTSISFGNLARGQKVWVGLCISLFSSSGSATFYWNSTLKSQSNKITDGWAGANNCSNPAVIYGPFNGTVIAASTLYYTAYFISIPADTPVQSYSWVLNIGSAP